MNLVEEFLQIVGVFEANDDIEYAICGGFAVTLLGAPRLTKDIDLLVPRVHIERAKELLRPLGYTISARVPFGHGTEAFMEIERVSKFEGEDFLTLDLLLVSPFLEDVWESRIRLEGHGRKLWVVDKMGLAKMKRQAGRPQDLLDLENLGIE
jgi:hypothetical protein